MNYKKFYNKIFLRRGAYFHRWGKFNKSYSEHVSRMRSFVQKGKTVLDLGCGDGYITSIISKKAKVTGADVSTEAVRLGKQLHPKLDLVLAMVSELPFNSESFDYVVLSKVIEHLKERDAATMLSEIKRVLKKNGQLALSTAYPINVWDRVLSLVLIWRPKDGEHVKEYTVDELRRFVAKYLKVRKIFCTADPPFFGHFPNISSLVWYSQNAFLKVFPFFKKYFLTQIYVVAINR